MFHEQNVFKLKDEGAELELVAERLKGETLAQFDITHKGKTLVETGKRITARHIKQIHESGLKSLHVPDSYLVGKILGRDVINKDTGEVIVPCQQRNQRGVAREVAQGRRQGSAHALRQRPRQGPLHLHHAGDRPVHARALRRWSKSIA